MRERQQDADGHSPTRHRQDSDSEGNHSQDEPTPDSRPLSGGQQSMGAGIGATLRSADVRRPVLVKRMRTTRAPCEI